MTKSPFRPLILLLNTND